MCNSPDQGYDYKEEFPLCTKSTVYLSASELKKHLKGKFELSWFANSSDGSEAKCGDVGKMTLRAEGENNEDIFSFTNVPVELFIVLGMLEFSFKESGDNKYIGEL